MFFGMYPTYSSSCSPSTTNLLTTLNYNSHCSTCKYLSGTDYTLNQIIPKEDFTLTKGNLKAYTYYGDSGRSLPLSLPNLPQTHLSPKETTLKISDTRQTRQLLLLP